MLSERLVLSRWKGLSKFLRTKRNVGEQKMSKPLLSKEITVSVETCAYGGHVVTHILTAA